MKKVVLILSLIYCFGTAEVFAFLDTYTVERQKSPEEIFLGESPGEVSYWRLLMRLEKEKCQERVQTKRNERFLFIRGPATLWRKQTTRYAERQLQRSKQAEYLFERRLLKSNQSTLSACRSKLRAKTGKPLSVMRQHIRTIERIERELVRAKLDMEAYVRECRKVIAIYDNLWKGVQNEDESIDDDIGPVDDQ